MIENEILALVDEHYQPNVTSVLMLSNVGARLRKDAKWPVPDDTRTLVEIAESMEGLALVRDPDAPSFIALVPVGHEQLALNAIANRKSRLFLRGLQRAVLFAFCLEVSQGLIVSLKLEPAPGYHVGSEIKPGYVLVDSDLRLPGLSVQDLDKLDASTVAQLGENIQSWCGRHNLTLESLIYRAPALSQHLPIPIQRSGLSALERLYEAQAPEVGSRLIVPIDIALALSRIR